MATNTEPASALHQNPGNEMKKTSNQRQKKKTDSQGINSIPSSKHITNARTNPNNNDLLANKEAKATNLAKS